jgi:hypothetical protein
VYDYGHNCGLGVVVAECLYYNTVGTQSCWYFDGEGEVMKPAKTWGGTCTVGLLSITINTPFIIIKFLQLQGNVFHQK